MFSLPLAPRSKEEPFKYLEHLEDGGAVVGDDHVSDVIDEHLVEADGTERRLDDVRDRHSRRHCKIQ